MEKEYFKTNKEIINQIKFDNIIDIIIKNNNYIKQQKEENTNTNYTNEDDEIYAI